MSSESDSETGELRETRQHQEVATPGWESILQDRGFFHLQPTHPKYPSKWKQRLAADRETLSQDEHVAGSVAALKAFWMRSRQEMDKIGIDRGFDAWFSEWAPIQQAVRDMIDAAAKDIRHPSISLSIRRAYLAEQISPEVRRWFPPGAPVEIMVNTENEPYFLIDPLAPGEIMVRFSDITARDLLHAGKLITDARARLLHNPIHRNRGGGPTLERQPTKRRKAEIAADLRRQGFSLDYIAEKLGVSPRTVRRYLPLGERILTDDDARRAKTRTTR